MAIPWGTIKSLLIFFGPVLIPRAIAYYRSARAASQAQHLKIQPLPASIARALLILLAVSAVFVARALVPGFSPENIFVSTQSRLQIPVDVLFTRLASLRPLSPADLTLKSRFVNIESRLLYLQFGPDPLSHCPFCTSDDAASYLYYALPSLLAPHVFNLVVLTLATSSFFTSRAAATWRTTATLSAVFIASLDLYSTATYTYQTNGAATRLPDLDFFFWSARTYRLLALAALDLLLGTALYLTGTNRAFVTPPPLSERVESLIRGLSATKGKINAVGVVKNTVLRDEDLRGRSNAYWSHEVRLTREIMEEGEVVEGMRDALENRLNIKALERDAEEYTNAMLGGIMGAAGGLGESLPIHEAGPGSGNRRETGHPAHHQKEE